MASLRKLPNSKYWIACYTDNTGQRKQRSTKEPDRRKAQKLAELLESAYRKDATEEHFRKVLSEGYKVIHGDDHLSETVEEFFTKWLKGKEVECAPATWKIYRGVVNRFLDAGDKADKDLSFITANDLINHRDNLAEKLTITTSNNHLAILRIAFTDALRSGLIESNPAALVHRIKRKGGTTNIRRAFTLPELKKILDVANNEWVGIILTGLYTGQRLGDIVSLTWDNVDVRREEISLTTIKTGRRILLPIAKPLLGHLLKLPAPDNSDTPVFPDAYRIVRRQLGRTSTLSNQFRSILVSAGLAPPRSGMAEREGRAGKHIGNPLSFHCLRHTTTSSLKNAGVGEAVAMDIVGHNT